MRKEDELKRILCNILEEICKTTFEVNVYDDMDFDETVYAPKFKSTPSFFFIKKEIKLIKELAEQEGKDFSILTGE